MNLKDNHITVGELLDDKRARGVIQRRFPMVLRQSLPSAARTVTLEQLLAFVGGYLPPRVIAETLEELKKL